MQVVPTDYNYANGRKLLTNQFSVTDHMRKLDSRSGRGLPGVFFFYDISPIRVRIEEKRRSFLSFLTSVCAIIGGVFTVRVAVARSPTSARTRVNDCFRCRRSWSSSTRLCTGCCSVRRAGVLAGC